MSRVEKLSVEQAREKAETVPEWNCGESSLRRSFEFGDFVEAFAFMSSVALLAEKRGHHPDWSNVYKKVDIELSTHDVGGLSEKDFELAAAIDRLLA